MSTLEKVVVRLFDKLFGRNLSHRLIKLDEEYKELLEAYVNYTKSPSPLTKKKLEEEIADVTGVLTHISDIVGISHEDKLLYVNDKLISRIENINIQRSKT